MKSAKLFFFSFRELLKKISVFLLVFYLPVNVFATKYNYPSGVSAINNGATYCQSGTATALSVTISTGTCGTGGLGTNIATSTSWYSNSTLSNSGGTLVSGPTASTTLTTTFTYTPSTVVVGTLYYYFVITWSDPDGASACTAGSITSTTGQMATVVVNQKSTNPTSASAGSTNICVGGNTTLTLNGGGGGTGTIVKWYSGSCGVTAAGTGNGLSVSPTVTTTYYGRYEDPSPCSFNTTCSSVTINVSPTVANAGSDLSACGNAGSATLAANTPTIGTGAWSVISGSGTFSNTASPTSTVSGLSVGANTLRWTITSGACTSSDDVIVTDATSCTYCTTGNATAITSYISNIDFNTISRASAWDGYINTGLQTSVSKTVSYNLALSTYNASVSAKNITAWIDWNSDGDFSDAGEQIVAATSITTASPPQTAINTFSITVPSGAITGTTVMRVGMLISATVSSCDVITLSDYEDYDIDVTAAPTNMVYDSSTTTQANTSSVNAGTYQNEVIGVKIFTSGTLSPLSVTSFTFNTAGTTSATNDILNAQLWTTTNNGTFATTTQVGSTVANPNGSFSFSTSTQLLQGTNYFWLTYDVKSTATSPDVIDATCISITVGSVRTPTITAPSGSRPIITATPMTYISCTTTQNVSRSPRPDTNHQIIGVEVVTSGAGSPLSATSFSFNTTGTSAVVTSNIANAKLWSTGVSSTFATTTQVGSTVAAPNGVFTITPSATLLNGTNYFWLSYDILSGAGCDPTQADAQCTSITVGGSARTLTVQSPLGAVVIDCNTPYYSTGNVAANLLSSWNSARNGSGSAPASFASTYMFYVQSGHTMTTSAAITIPYLTVEAGGYVKASFLITCTDLRINSYGTFEQIVQATSGTYITNFYIENYGTWIHNNAGYLPSGNRYFSPRSNQWFYQYGGGTFVAGTSWGNVLLNATTTGNFAMGGVLTTIQGDFEWRRIGTNNYLIDDQNETINVGGDLIFSGGWWKGAYDGSVPGNQTKSLVINVGGNFTMTSGTFVDYARGSNSTGTTLNINGNVTITGGTFNFNTSPSGSSPINLTVGNSSSTWKQTGGTVTLGNTNIKTGKTLTLVGSKIGDVATSRTLIVESGATLKCSNYPVSGTGLFTLSSGGKLSIGSLAGIVSSGASGNVQVSSTRSYNSGATYEYYEGLTPQATGNFTTTTTSGTYPSQVTNFIVNKTNATDIVTLTNTTDVSSTLTLTNGILKTSYTAATAPWIRIPSAGSVSPVGGSASSFVDGYIRRQGATAFTFPTGNSGRWRRIGITAPSISTELEARYIFSPYTNTTIMSGSPVTVLDHVSSLEYWQLNKPSADAATTKAQLFWENASASGIYKFDSLAVGRWSGTGWEDANCYSSCPANWTTSTTQRTYTGSASGTGIGTIQSNTLASTSFGPFTLGSIGNKTANPLPIELISFRASCENNDVLLRWTTKTEINNSYFTIEKSSDGISYSEIATVRGAGNSSVERNYSFADKGSSKGVAYYRLTQTDFDGHAERFKEISAKCNKNGRPSVYAYNNQQGNIIITIQSDMNDRYAAKLFDAFGKNVSNLSFDSGKGFSMYKIDIAAVSSGIYFITITGEESTVTQKIFVN